MEPATVPDRDKMDRRRGGVTDGRGAVMLDAWLWERSPPLRC